MNAFNGSPAPVRLRIDDRPSAPTPRGQALPVASSALPRLSWSLPVVRQGQAQSGYQIRACGQDEDPRDAPALWDSGRVDSDQTAHVAWGGTPLRAYCRVRWTVRSWDERGAVSAWAEPVEFPVGPLTEADWTARWIALPPTHAARVEFTLPGPVRSAHLYFAAHGLVRAVLDGTPVNAEACDPTRTALGRAAARGYDVTAILRSGTAGHALAIAVGIGHYRAVRSAVHLLAEFVVELTDGRVVRVGTSQDWRHGPTSVVREDPLYLEERDARIPDDWGAAGFDDSRWAPVAAVTDPPSVRPDSGPPVHAVEARVPTRLAGEAVVFDVGENIAGRSRVRVSGAPAGTRVEIVHAEKLGPGGVDTRNIRMPQDHERERQVVALTCAGTEDDIAEAWFGYFGFRYVEVRGLPPGARVEVTVSTIHSLVPQTGFISTDDPLLDRLVAMALRTQLNNLHGHPEDCPTREQSGWTGDAAVSAEAAFAHLDLAGVYRHWLGDLVADQREDGAIPSVSPHVLGETNVQPPDPVWGAALTEIAVQHWRHVGDESFVRAYLPAIRRWCDWQLDTVEDGLVRGADISFGADWLALEQTPPVLLQTAAVIRSLRALAELEQAAGDAASVITRTKQADELVAAARSRLCDPVTGQWANGSQGSSAIALCSGLVDDAARESTVDALRAAVHASDGRLRTGYAATQSAVRALADAGGAQLLAAVHQAAQPGVGAMLADGPGTFWETWWIDDDNSGVASLDHIGLAAPFAAWVWNHVAGVRVEAGGLVTFGPRLLGPVRRVRARRDTVRGPLEVEWELVGTVLNARLLVPVGCTVAVDLPATAMTVDGVSADGAVMLPAGEYRIRAELAGLDVARPAIGAGPDIAPGGRVDLPILVSGDGDVEVSEPGWGATVLNGRLAVSAPDDAPVGATAVVSLGPARRVVRVGRSQLWLHDAGWSAESAVVRVRPETVVCGPVYHEPIPGPTLDVIGSPRAAGDPEWLTLRLALPANLTEAWFAFAHLDLCDAGLPGIAIRPTLTLTSSDGTQVSAGARPMPASWTRIAVDLSAWAGRASVIGVAVGVSWTSRHDPARGPQPASTTGPFPLRFRMARVGWTSAPRTW
jgi:alpha-L-rhamnosidase